MNEIKIKSTQFPTRHDEVHVFHRAGLKAVVFGWVNRDTHAGIALKTYL